VAATGALRVEIDAAHPFAEARQALTDFTATALLTFALTSR
jgi:hypothetical protein